MSKYLNSASGMAEAAEERDEENEMQIAALEGQVQKLTIANDAMKDLLEATTQALDEAYATLQSQAVEIAMLQRKLSKKIVTAGVAGVLGQVLGDIDGRTDSQ